VEGEHAKKMNIQTKTKRTEIAEKKAKIKAIVLMLLGFAGGISWVYNVLTLKMLSDELLTRKVVIASVEAKTPENAEFEATQHCGLVDVICEGERKKAILSVYNAEIGQTDSSPTIMANGRTVHERAVASNCYPLGTKLEIEGIGEVTVEDRMNKRYTEMCGTEDERMDLFRWNRADNFKKAIIFKITK
jgi:3D (Asp-Asp-Asp) domain-containing protein